MPVPDIARLDRPQFGAIELPDDVTQLRVVRLACSWPKGPIRHPLGCVRVEEFGAAAGIEVVTALEVGLHTREPRPSVGLRRER